MMNLRAFETIRHEETDRETPVERHERRIYYRAFPHGRLARLITRSRAHLVN